MGNVINENIIFELHGRKCIQVEMLIRENERLIEENEKMKKQLAENEKSKAGKN